MSTCRYLVRCRILEISEKINSRLRLSSAPWTLALDDLHFESQIDRSIFIIVFFACIISCCYLESVTLIKYLRVWYIWAL